MANRSKAFDPHVLTIADLKEHGSKKMEKMYRDYINEGSQDLITVHDNEEAYNRYKIRPRVLVNVRNVDTSTTFLGVKVDFPLGFSPAATHKIGHPDGELATSRAAAKQNIAMCLSAYSSYTLEQVASEGLQNPYIMQLTILRDRAASLKLIRRTEKAGYKAIFLTVDCPVLGPRLNEIRNNFVLPPDSGFPNWSDEVAGNLETGNTDKEYDDELQWDEIIPWIRAHTKLPIWVKGVYTAEDTLLAVRHGLDGVVISNHGGRQLDGVPATLDALRECAPVAKGKIGIAVDGGIRRGSDIFKALALGADHCFVGRVLFWGLAYNGQDGVELALKILQNEFRMTMGLAGCKSVSEINRGHLSLLQTNGLLSKL